MERKVLKRPRCGYTFFCKDNWQKVSNDLQTTNSKMIIPVLAGQWNDLPENQRAVFNERAQKEKKEFEEARRLRMENLAAAFREPAREPAPSCTIC